jgi:hypothetical protein
MEHDETPTTRDEMDRELEALLREHAERGRPDRRRPRGTQEVEEADVDRARERLGSVLGW